MGKHTEQKLKKVLGEGKLEQIKHKKNKVKKPAVKKKSKLKIVTEDMESRNTTIILVALVIIFGGLGVYFKFVSSNDSSGEIEMRSTEFFGNAPPPVDNMLEVQTLTKEQLQKYTWRDNPIWLANRFEIIAFIRSSNMKVRIKDNKLPESTEIPLRGPGNYLTEQFKIIDIQDPVVFLSDKDGKIHRLVDDKSWNLAATVFNWKKNLFGNPEENATVNEDEGMSEEVARITFGEFELVNASDEQISLLREWEDANPDYSFDDFASACSRIGVSYEHKLPATMGGMLTLRPDEVDDDK